MHIRNSTGFTRLTGVLLCLVAANRAAAADGFDRRASHMLSNSGTAWAVIALAECGELLPADASR
jgi:hypothetical protein